MCHLYGGGIAGPSGGNLSIGAEVNPATQECAGGDDDGVRCEPPPIASLDATDPSAALIEEQVCDHALRELEGRELLEQKSNRALVQGAVRLRARGPDGGTLRAIQHPELDCRAIGGATHDTAEGVDLADDGTLCDAADRGIAAHLADCVQHRSE